MPTGTPLLRLALDSCVGRSCASRLMRPRLLIPRSFGKGQGSVGRIAGTYLAADTAGMAKSIKGLPAGFIFPAQPVKASNPPVGTDWFTKSNTRATELSFAGTVQLCGSTAATPKLDGATGGDRGCCRADQGQELHD
jgi:hypothetical protein